MKPWLRHSYLIGLFGITLTSATHAVMARDAAFIDPALVSTGGEGSDAIKVEPKNDVDIGETILSVARHTNLFFINQTSLAIHIAKIDVTGDGNVAVDVTNNDCMKQQTIAPQSRCSVEFSVTPSSPGPWGVDVLMTHDGPGRIVRAKVSGKTSGSTASDEKKSMGLMMSSKESSSVTFGDVESDGGKAVRSALMINDSTDPITIYSIDVIEAENGLQRLEQGCAVDMELKPGESCPVTLLWAPKEHGTISTDLIIRHSGKMGFTVIPIRGTAKGGETKSSDGKNADNGKVIVGSHADDANGKKNDLKNPPSANELERAADKVAASALLPATEGELKLHLIGTVGNRAILLKPDGTSLILGAGDTIESGSSSKILVTAVGTRSVDISVDGIKRTYPLEASQDLISRAKDQAHSDHNKDSNSKDKDAPADSPAPDTSGAPGSVLGSVGDTSTNAANKPSSRGR